MPFHNDITRCHFHNDNNRYDSIKLKFMITIYRQPAMETVPVAPDDSAGANPSSVKSDDSSPRPDSRSGSPPPNCAICLGTCKNKSFTDSCLHQFCFTCLLTWSKVSLTNRQLFFRKILIKFPQKSLSKVLQLLIMILLINN